MYRFVSQTIYVFSLFRLLRIILLNLFGEISFWSFLDNNQDEMRRLRS